MTTTEPKRLVDCKDDRERLVYAQQQVYAAVVGYVTGEERGNVLVSLGLLVGLALRSLPPPEPTP